MPKVQRMFLDNLIEESTRVCEKLKMDINQMSPGILPSAHLFLINSAVASDLYEIPSERTNYDAGLHLPFDIVFFELMESISISLNDGISKKLKGILAMNNVGAGDPTPNFGDADPRFHMTLFYESLIDKQRPAKIYPYADSSKIHGAIDLDMIEFKFNRLPEFQISMNGENYICHPDKSISFAGFSLKSIKSYKRHTNLQQYEDYEKIRNLCINIIEYINAHNVIIKKEEGNVKELEKVNRKRRNKGKASLPEVRPYYWIELKEQTITEKKKEDSTNSGEGSAMDYREWVRGHFIRYHYKVEGQDVVKRLWRQPFVRGPAGAPWKEKRYEVLDDLLRKGPKYQSSE